MKRGVQPLRKLYGRTPAVEFGVVQFKAVRQTLIDEDLSRPYVNEIVRRIVSFFAGGPLRG